MTYKKYLTQHLYGKGKLYVKYKDHIHQVRDVWDYEYVQLYQYDAMYDIKRIDNYNNEIHMQF